MKNTEFFLGGASPDGFRTDFGRLIYDGKNFTYIIKGTAGSGKSTLMKKLAAAFPEDSKEIYSCSADPDSLDAVYFTDRNIIIVDGTAPHVFEPKYPFARQMLVDMGLYLAQNSLYEKREDIVSVTDDYSQCHVRCRRYLTALAAIIADMKNIGQTALNTEKLSGFTDRMCRKLLPKKSHASCGKISFKPISAVTPLGYITKIPKDWTVYLLNDDHFAGSDEFLHAFADNASKRGYDVVVSESTLHTCEHYEHILIPEINTALVTSGPLCRPEAEGCRPVNFRRFYDKNILADKKVRMKFNKNACEDLLDEAVYSLVCAKAYHDKLEHFYIESADFASVNRLLYRLISDIKSKSKS